MAGHPVNHPIAEQLRQIADLLEQQQANPFRVRAYRQAAATVAGWPESLQALFDRAGIQGLIALPDIGRGIARAIYEILALGRSSRLDSLRGSLDPERLFQTIPGVGPALARQIHEQLHLDSLEALEMAAHDGRLDQVPGVGERRAAAIRAALTTLLGARLYRRPPVAAGVAGPSVALLLEIDAEYRRQAEAGELPTIAPRRFNPEARPWLPIWHCDRAGWHFTVLYSNSPRAHELGRARDWVLIYWYDDEHHEDQQTVVTEYRGPLVGRRVVRGRERECQEHYTGQGVVASSEPTPGG